MPTYEYACRECEERLEVVQSFSDDPLTVCPRCGGQLRKVFNAAGIIFKGSGYYVTDSRKPAGATSNGSSEGSTNAGGDESTKTSSDTASKPTSDKSPGSSASTSSSPSKD